MSFKQKCGLLSSTNILLLNMNHSLAFYFFRHAIQMGRRYRQRISIYEYTIVINAFTSMLKAHYKYAKLNITSGSLLLYGKECCQHLLNAIILLPY
jgi:hypothetical protein